MKHTDQKYLAVLVNKAKLDIYKWNRVIQAW